MGKKGFTLVELIAVVFLISLVFGIATYSVFGIINNSKKKSEELFVEEIDKAISQYIGLYGSSLVKGSSTEFNKCILKDCSESENVSAVEIFNGSIDNCVKLSDLIKEDFFDSKKLINPVNKKDCLLNEKDPSIRIFKDSDYVYYYYVDLSGDNTTCEISIENGIINTLPNDLKLKVGI